jgi:hypothetical protein
MINRSVLRDKVGRFAQSWWAVGLIGLLVGTIVYQRWAALHPQPLRPALSVGERLAPVTVRTLEDQEVTVEWGSGRPAAIIYVFSPGCVHCTRNAASARALLEHVGGYRIIGLSLSAKGLKQYVEANQIRFPVYVSANGEAASVWKIGATPSTILATGDGEVQKVWVGTYTGDRIQELESRFGLKLPPLPAM